MRTSLWSALVLWASVCLVAAVGAQTPVGALAINERQGDRWGWAGWNNGSSICRAHQHR